MRDNGIKNLNRGYSCYVLMGYPGDTFGAAEKRLTQILRLGLMTMAMLYNLGSHFDGEEKKKWKQLQREYANKWIVGSKLSEMEKK